MWSTITNNNIIYVLCDNVVIARLGLTTWGKWKIIGEDVYADNWNALVERLKGRGLV